MVIVETQPAVDLNPLGQRQRIEGINPEGIGLAVGVRPVSVQPANRQVAHRMVEIHRRRGPGVNAIVGLVFPGKLHAGADVMAYRASIESRGDIGLVGQNAVADIFGINQTRPAPGVDVIDIGGGDIVRAAHHRGQKILLFHSRPAGGIAHGGILRQIVFEAQGTAVGSRFIVIGVGAIEIAGIDLPGGVECGILRRRRRIARQADGRDPAIRGVVLPDVQIVQIQTSWGIKAEGQRRCDAIAFVFNAVPTSVMGFFPHQVQTERSVVAKRLVQVESAPARPGAADAGRAVDPGVKARLLADHIDRAGGRAAAIVRAGGPFDDFHLLGIEGIARHAADVANAVHIDAVRGIHAAHKDGIPGG